MKRSVYAAFAAALIVSCASEGTHKRVVPLPAGYGPENLADVCVPAYFTVANFDWVSGTLTMKVYSEDLYDIVDVHDMAPGDTIFYYGQDIVVKDTSSLGEGLEINGGFGEENGASLVPYEGGTWRAVQWDDHSVYTEVCTAKVPLAENFRIVDCGELYETPSDTVTFGQREYLDGLKRVKRTFSCLDTRVLIEDGKITEIVRRWIP